MSQQDRIEKVCTKCSMKIWWNREDTSMKNTGSWYGINGLIHNAGNCAKVLNESPPKENTPKIPYKLKVLETQAISPINAKIDYLMDLRFLVEERVKGTTQENNQAAIGQLLNLLIEQLKPHEHS